MFVDETDKVTVEVASESKLRSFLGLRLSLAKALE